MPCSGKLGLSRSSIDALVVSVALLHGPGLVAPDPDLLVPLMELQLKRLEHAAHLYKPDLTACTPHLGGEQVADWRADYTVRKGQAFPIVNDTFDDLAAAQEEVEASGVVDSYVVSQNISGTAVGADDGAVWFAGRTRAFIDDDHATEFLAATRTVLEEDGYTEIEEMADVPELGDDAVADTYVGSDGNAAAIAYVQVADQMVSLRLGSTTEAVSDVVLALAEEHLERVTEDDCTLLTKDLGVSHDDAMHRLWETFHGMPVDLIVQAQGDMSRTLEQLTGQPPEPYVNGGAPDARVLRREITRAATSQQQGQEPDPQDFNAQIRARASRSSGAVDTLTSGDIMAAGTDRRGEAYDPAADPFRQRFAERAAERLG